MLAALRRLPPRETILLLIAFAILVALAARGDGDKAPALGFSSYSSYDAAPGGYRAWYELLEREATVTSRFELRPAFLDGSLDTLVYAEPEDNDPRQISLTPADIAALEAWVKHGGHLLYIGRDDVAAKHGILGLPRSVLRKGPAGAVSVAPELARAGVATVLPRTGRRFIPRKRTVLLRDARGALAVEYARGKGSVTALIDETLFANDRIALGDHARLAYALVRPRGTVAFSELQHGHEVPLRWWQIVPRPFTIALALGALVLLVAFAGESLRLGPPLVPPAQRDATSVEFLDAMAGLLARANAYRAAMVDALDSTRLAAARSVGLDASASVERVAERLPAPVGTDLLALAQTARGGYPNEKNLIRGLALAQRVRKELTSHVGPRY